MYKSKLSINETQQAIGIIKSVFPTLLANELNLTRATAPLFLDPKTGLNDGLSGEEPVKFKVKGYEPFLEIVHSLAKWKRHSLATYKYTVGQGIYADMNAIRREEIQDNLHSYYVDQWDWEKVIEKSDRNEKFLKMIVNSIYRQIQRMEYRMKSEFAQLEIKLPNKLTFIDSQELEDMFPKLTPSKREDEFAKKVGAFFVMNVGYELKSGSKHSDRAVDYDDWKLNGDLIVFHPVLNKAIELSSMGIRVDKQAIIEQSKKTAEELKKQSPYHKGIIEETLPFSIGGGIGQSRLCMFLLEKAHIGEVQSSYWSEKEIQIAFEQGIKLL